MTALTIPTVSRISIYPVKSCAGMSMPITILTPQGFLFDRQWRITYGDANERGVFDTLTQRECPRMALIQTEMRGRYVVLSLPGD